MNTEKAKILVLVEGEKTDVQLLEHLLCVYGINKRHQIISYNTNIYALYDQMFRDNPDDIDIQQLLKERESNPERKKIFDIRYTDVLLIFDLDPQDPRFEAHKIKRMVSYFNESSEMGKLYLNYPMVEAFYHMKSIPDKDYISYYATIEELHNKSYKARVRNECRSRNYKKFAATKDECDTVIKQNIHKAELLTHSAPGSLYLPESSDILDAQLIKLKKESAVSVLCTCIFYIPDYNPTLID